MRKKIKRNKVHFLWSWQEEKQERNKSVMFDSDIVNEITDYQNFTLLEYDCIYYFYKNVL